MVAGWFFTSSNWFYFSLSLWHLEEIYSLPKIKAFYYISDAYYVLCLRG